MHFLAIKIYMNIHCRHCLLCTHQKINSLHFGHCMRFDLQHCDPLAFLANCKIALFSFLQAKFLHLETIKCLCTYYT